MKTHILNDTWNRSCFEKMPSKKNDEFNLKTETEILQERAEVLGRAGEALSSALSVLNAIEERITVLTRTLTAGESAEETYRAINREIKQFNRAREHAKVRYYYLIVTREAMGFRRHSTVEEAYRIPPRKKPLMRME